MLTPSCVPRPRTAAIRHGGPRRPRPRPSSVRVRTARKCVECQGSPPGFSHRRFEPESGLETAAFSFLPDDTGATGEYNRMQMSEKQLCSRKAAVRASALERGGGKHRWEATSSGRHDSEGSVSPACGDPLRPCRRFEETVLPAPLFSQPARQRNMMCPGGLSWALSLR